MFHKDILTMTTFDDNLTRLDLDLLTPDFHTKYDDKTLSTTYHKSPLLSSVSCNYVICFNRGRDPVTPAHRLISCNIFCLISQQLAILQRLAHPMLNRHIPQNQRPSLRINHKMDQRIIVDQHTPAANCANNVTIARRPTAP